jgi:hypothetical protein
MTTLQCTTSWQPHTLAGFELGIFCFAGGRDDHYATPSGLHKVALFECLPQLSINFLAKFFQPCDQNFTDFWIFANEFVWIFADA